MQTKPFTFENFGADTAAKPFVPLVREEIPQEKRTYTAQDLLLAERKGHERGYQEGVEAGKKVGQTEEAEINRILTASLQSLEKKLGTHFHNFNATVSAAASDTTNLTLSIAQKVAGDALGANPHANIEALVHQCIDLLFVKADIILTLHPDALAPVQKKLEAMAERHNFKGKIHYKTDPALQASDCTLAWPDGGARLDTPETWQKIKAILAQHGLHHEAPTAITSSHPEQREGSQPTSVDPSPMAQDDSNPQGG